MQYTVEYNESTQVCMLNLSLDLISSLHKVMRLHIGFVFVRFYFEYEGAERPSALPEKRTTQSLPQDSAQESTIDCARHGDTSFPYTLYF